MKIKKSNIIKKLLLDSNMSINDFCLLANEKDYNIKPQVFSNKLYRDSFTLDEFTFICNLLNATLIIKSNNNEYEILPDKDKVIKKYNNLSKR